MEYKAHDYQEYVINKIINTKKILIALDMGLGKTSSTLSALNYLIFNSLEIQKVLIIGPKKVASVTWSEEIKKFDHLKYLSIEKILGNKTKRIQSLNTPAYLYTINRENVSWLIDYYLEEKREWDFDCIVIDESSSFKSYKSKRFKQLKKVCGLTERVIELTGTPSPNGLEDLWSQIYLLDQGQRLGKNITAFRNEYCFVKYRISGMANKYSIREGAKEIIYDKLKDIMISLKTIDHLKMPERIDNFIKVELPTKVLDKYNELEREYVLELGEEEITAKSAAVVTNKLLQLANGRIYDENKNVIELHNEKLEMLIEIIEENENQPILVFYNFKHDLDTLQKGLEKYKPRLLKEDKDFFDWNNKEIRVLLAHPASMGHGLNLQSGGNIIVWYGLNWSLELYQQANARLYRQGQKNTVVINHLISKDTVDELVIDKLKAKEANQDDLLNAMKVRIKDIRSKIKK